MIVIYILAILLEISHAYVNLLKCSTPLSTSSTIMGFKCASSSSRTIQVKRGSVVIPSGSSYIPGESLSISLSSTSGQYVFEINIGSFTSGTCNRHTSYDGTTATLVLPKSGAGVINIKAAYAASYSTVYLTNIFTLSEGIIPSNTPTSYPTVTLTTILPTVKPTAMPTYQIGAPTPVPTTSNPSSIPTSFNPTLISTYSPSTITTQSLVAPDAEYNVVIEFANDKDILFNTDVTNAFENALGNILKSSISDPASIEISSTSSISIVDTLSPSLKPTKNPLPEHDDEHHHDHLYIQLQQLQKYQQKMIPLGSNSINIKVYFIVAYILQNTIYTSISDLQSALDTALYNSIDTSTQLLDAIKASNIAELQNLSSSSYVSINSITPSDDDDAKNSNDDAYHQSFQKKLIIGLVVGGISCGIIAFCIYLFFSTSDEVVLNVFDKINQSYIWIAIATAGAAIGLVATWAHNDNGEQTGYLGKPSWDTNIFAWHPILMVCYFFCQLQAIFNWSLFTNHTIAKLSHVATQFIALVVMLIGLIAVVKDNFDKKSPSLTTMHAWIGVCSIALFGVNFIWGACMALLTIFHPESKLRRLVALLQFHRIIGSSALVLTTGAILTGIMDYLPYGACFYILSSQQLQEEKDTDPAENYAYLPDACKIANGLGIVVVVSCMFGIISIISRAIANQNHQILTTTSNNNNNQLVQHTYISNNRGNDDVESERLHIVSTPQTAAGQDQRGVSDPGTSNTTTTAIASVARYKSIPTATVVIPLDNNNNSISSAPVMLETYEQHR